MDQQIKDIPCVILAGGFGMRLRSEVQDIAKPMAPMGDKPFLHVLMDKLHTEGIHKFVLAVGYLAETIQAYFAQREMPYEILYSIEEEPLGTGGALKKALFMLDAEYVFALNGDTFFDLNLKQFYSDARQSSAPFFMALMQLQDASRYGGVRLEEGKVKSFNEKQTDASCCNAGVYAFRTELLKNHPENQFSLERDFLPKLAHEDQIAGQIYDAYFIDIGIPEDYRKARDKFAKYFIDSSWTLFLDRDGVINERLVGDYVKRVEDFHFKAGALEAIAAFTQMFGRIVVVTNQQGIGKKLMTVRNLAEIHRYMVSEIEKQGGRIDAVYFAPQLAKEDSEMRKPKQGMAWQAKSEFREIDFTKSVMIGDSDSDIWFGKNLGMITVKLSNVDESHVQADVHREKLVDCIVLFEKL